MQCDDCVLSIASKPNPMKTEMRAVKPPTIRDVALLAGVAESTVSRVLTGAETSIAISEDTRQRVLQAASDLAYEAAVRALDDAGIDGSALDAVLVGTVSADYLFPATGCLLQERLGAKRAFAYDFSAACSGSPLAEPSIRS